MRCVRQLPSPELKATVGKWTTIRLDLAALMRDHLGEREGTYHCVKGLVACSSMALRAVFLSDSFYTPETLPTDFLLPTRGKAWRDVHEWVDLPPQPPPPLPLSVEGHAVAEVPPARVPLADALRQPPDDVRHSTRSE